MITRFLLGQAGLKTDDADSGAVTLIQRFGSAANLTIHLHCLVLDGVYRHSEAGPVFVEVKFVAGGGRFARRDGLARCVASGSLNSRPDTCHPDSRYRPPEIRPRRFRKLTLGTSGSVDRTHGHLPPIQSEFSSNFVAAIEFDSLICCGDVHI